MYQHILVATDLSELSKLTAKKAWQLASQFECKLSIVHVIEPLPVYGYPGITPIQSPPIDEIKRELAEFAKEFHIPEPRQHVEIGPPKFEVLHVAEQIRADLIVVGSHGEHGILSFLGSTANAILHSAECDVLVVRIQR